MRLVVQRVKKAEVTVVSSGKVAGSIEKGLFVLVGVKKGDTKKEAEILANKIVKLRVMADEAGKMNLSVVDTKSKILAVSQFTLYADTKGGNRPSFIQAEDPEKAVEIYNHFVAKIKELGVETEIGSFGSEMKIDTELDGPVTIIFET
ncbi:MAG TPA: D-aminoacyl-tRNA deacylase [Patescibacteria group bacterium]